jgi:hypothetical protein
VSASRGQVRKFLGYDKNRDRSFSLHVSPFLDPPSLPQTEPDYALPFRIALPGEPTSVGLLHLFHGGPLAQSALALSCSKFKERFLFTLKNIIYIGGGVERGTMGYASSLPTYGIIIQSSSISTGGPLHVS